MTDDRVTERYLGERIARAREIAGLSQAELGELVGLSQTALSRIESGQRQLTSLELVRLAERLDVAVVDLLEAQPLAARLEVAARGGTLAGTERAMSRLIELVRVAGVLGSANTEGQKHFDHPALTGHDVEDGGALARAARQAWDLGDDPLPNLSSVVEHRAGLHLAVEPFDGAIAGLTARLDGVALALVDSSSPYGRQRFTIAHELCHYLRGEGSPMDDGDLLLVDRTIANTPGEERRANAFAAELLMPTAAVGRYARGRDLTDAVIVELQYVFGVSLDALLWRLHNLGRLNEAQRELLSAAGARTLATRHGYAAEWQAGEALRGARRPPQRLFERALAAYSGGAVGLELLARLSGRTDLDAVRRELDDAGVPSSSSWWESDAPA